MRLVYAEQALGDLQRLRAFIAEKDPVAAQRIGRQLVQRLERLCDFPQLGRPVSLAPDPATLRDMMVGKYVVRYSVHSQTLVILRIWHQHEDRPTGYPEQAP